MTYVSAGLIDPKSGRARPASIRAAVRALTGRMLYPIAFPTALAVVIRAARKEAEIVAEQIVAGKAHERLMVERQAEARRLAAHYQFDVDRLSHEVDRRMGGSFATTLAGSSCERDRFNAALKIARTYRDSISIAAE